MNTAGRRRKQAVGDYGHIAPQRRPHYFRTTKEIAEQRLQALIRKERAITARTGRRKAV